MVTEDPKPTKTTRTLAATDLTGAGGADRARVKRLGLDPDKMSEDDGRRLQRMGIEPDTFERKAVTYKGLIEEFGKPIGPRLYNDIAVAAFGGVPANRGDLSIETLKDRWIGPRTANESDEDFNKRLEKHRAARERVMNLIADAERGAN